MGFIAKLFGGGKKQSAPRPQATPAAPVAPVERNLNGAIISGLNSSPQGTFLDEGGSSRQTFLGG